MPNLTGAHEPHADSASAQHVRELMLATQMTAEDLAEVLSEALASTRITTAIPASELDTMLAESGLSAGDQREVRHDWADQTRTSAKSATLAVLHARLAGERLTTSEAAERIGVSNSTITRRVAARTLLATHDSRGALRIPAWQFAQEDILAGWDIVAPAFAGVDLRTVESFIDTPQDELEGLSPLVWLTAGHDPQPVVALAKSVTAW